MDNAYPRFFNMVRKLLQMLCALIMIFKYIVYLNLGIKYIIKYYVLLITYVSKRITIFDYTYSTDLTFSKIETLKLVLVRSKFRKEKRRKKGGNFRRLLVKFSFPLGIIEREKLLMSFCVFQVDFSSKPHYWRALHPQIKVFSQRQCLLGTNVPP